MNFDGGTFAARYVMADSFARGALAMKRMSVAF
jgi:hypothetical protein